MPEWLSILLGILGSLGILSAAGKFIFDAAVKRTKTQIEKIQAYDEQAQTQHLRTIIKEYQRLLVKIRNH